MKDFIGQDVKVGDIIMLFNMPYFAFTEEAERKEMAKSNKKVQYMFMESDYRIKYLKNSFYPAQVTKCSNNRCSYVTLIPRTLSQLKAGEYGLFPYLNEDFKFQSNTKKFIVINAIASKMGIHSLTDIKKCYDFPELNQRLNFHYEIRWVNVFSIFAEKNYSNGKRTLDCCSQEFQVGQFVLLNGSTGWCLDEAIPGTASSIQKIHRLTPASIFYLKDGKQVKVPKYKALILDTQLEEFAKEKGVSTIEDLHLV